MTSLHIKTGCGHHQNIQVPALTCELSGAGCNDKEKDYIESYKSKSVDEVAKEITRLNKMKSGKMKPELQQWLDRRVHILSKFTSASKDL